MLREKSPERDDLLLPCVSLPLDSLLLELSLALSVLAKKEVAKMDDYSSFSFAPMNIAIRMKQVQGPLFQRDARGGRLGTSYKNNF